MVRCEQLHGQRDIPFQQRVGLIQLADAVQRIPPVADRGERPSIEAPPLLARHSLASKLTASAHSPWCDRRRAPGYSTIQACRDRPGRALAVGGPGTHGTWPRLQPCGRTLKVQLHTYQVNRGWLDRRPPTGVCEFPRSARASGSDSSARPGPRFRKSANRLLSGECVGVFGAECRLP